MHMSTITSSANTLVERLHGLDWARLNRELDWRGFAATDPVLEEHACRELADLFDGDGFRSTVEMARHRFGDGRYRYFAHPLPPLVQAARTVLYEHLAPIANRWSERLSGDARFPDTLEGLLECCHESGQDRPTPLILRYREGDWNALHRDLYGEVYFPFQVVMTLSDPERDYAAQ